VAGEEKNLNDKWDIDKGRVILNGTQGIARVLLAQSMLDARNGLSTAGYISGYRGSPLGNVDTTLWDIAPRLKAAKIHFQPGVNEDLAATAVAGTQQFDQVPGARYDGVFAAWYGKGPGVDRSGDAFKHGNYAGAHAKGGVVVFYGDDHAGKSSTVAFQSEQAVAASAIPCLYPSDVGELVEYGLLAFALSRHSGSWVAVKCVNEVVEQTATVDLDLEIFAAVLPTMPDAPPEGFHAAVRPFNPLRDEQIVVEHRLALIAPFVRANRIDRTVFRSPAPRLGVVSTGKSFGDVRQALRLLGMTDEKAAASGLSLYKVGCIWPLDGVGLAAFAKDHDILLVIEEKKSFLEAQAAVSLIHDRTAPRLIGKIDEDGRTLLSSTLPLEPAEIAVVIADRLDRLGLLDETLRAARETLVALRSAGPAIATAPKRSPFFCSGCPHSRSTKIPQGSLSMTGIGCHTMANFVRPKEAMLPAQMGGEGANWFGIAPFTDTPHIFQNMGDGTYYHSGLLAIRAAVAARVNITYKILYNDAVAMTGGQPVDGPISVAEIAQQVRHEGVEHLVVVSDNPDHHRANPNFPSNTAIEHRDNLDRIQRALREVPGCSVLIYEQTCAAEKRRRRKRGTMPDPAKRLFIADSVCEGCGDCSVQSTCVSILPKETELGLKRAIDQSNCNKDYSCVDGFCPSFITIHGAEPRKPKGVTLDEDVFASLPYPSVREGNCNIIVAGIGGTGVITVGALLGMAAHIDDRAASLFDMTGLAQKNGAVFSHIRIAGAVPDICTQRIGRGEADVLLAFDAIAAMAPEAANCISPGKTRAVANGSVSPTLQFQFDRDAAPDADVLLAGLQQTIGAENFLSANATAMALALTGNIIGANLMIVGMAAQSGMLPVSVEAIEQAIRLNRTAVRLNLTAFGLGRLFVADREKVLALAANLVPPVPQPKTLHALIEHRARHLTDYQSEALAADYRRTVDAVFAAESLLDGRPGSDDLTRTVASNLAKVLAIKDEYEVARLLTDANLQDRIAREFEDGARIGFNLAPPFLTGTAPNGRPRKREFPAWAVLPIFRVLRHLRKLRGTPFDVLGWTLERREERALAREYEALVSRTVADLTNARLDAAVELLGMVDQVRGFGPVKQAAMANYRVAVLAAEARYREANQTASHRDEVLSDSAEIA